MIRSPSMDNNPKFIRIARLKIIFWDDADPYAKAMTINYILGYAEAVYEKKEKNNDSISDFLIAEKSISFDVVEKVLLNDEEYSSKK